MFFMINERIIVVADSNKKIKKASIANRDLEGNSKESTKMICEAIKCCSTEVENYVDVVNFIQNINRHKTDVIFPMKYGRNAPNSKSILPGICEGANLRYIGADDYAQIICNDKYTSKLYAKQFGIKSAPAIISRPSECKNELLERMKQLNLPVIVKPNFGGGSTGISENNVCFDYQHALDLVSKLLFFHKLPILIEEYISGEEVELILVGNKNKIILSEEVQLLMGDKKYYDKEIWGFETKKIDDSNIDFQMSNLISSAEISHIHSLFKSFEKMEFMRVDGRIHEGQFYLIELSPDCYLGNDCAFYFAFNKLGYSFPEMFELLINNGLDHYRH